MILFVSDLHLSADAPAITDRFEAFLGGPVRNAQALFILGDLFEYWAGDDDLDDPLNTRIVRALRGAVEAGVQVSFLAGNRDFLVGTRFAEAAGIALLDDPYVLSVPAWQFVLTHGDTLCSDDVEYQAFRTQVRQPAWQTRFLDQPLAERKRQIAAIRARSLESKAAKSAAIMDVNAGTTEDFIREHGYATVIHGHTHRPATHDHIVDGIHCERWVLADWRADGGEAICWDGERLQRLAV